MFVILIFQKFWNISKADLTLYDFCRAMHQIGYDMKRRVIAEDRVIWLKPLRFNLSHYTINFSRLRIFLRLAAISIHYDGLWFPPNFSIVTNGISMGLTLQDIFTTLATGEGAIAMSGGLPCRLWTTKSGLFICCIFCLRRCDRSSLWLAERVFTPFKDDYFSIK